MAKRGRPRIEGSQSKPKPGEKSRGNRKVGKAKSPTIAGDLDARHVVQWLRDHTKHNMMQVAKFTGLDYQFVRRRAARDTVDTVARRGPKHIIGDSELPSLVAQVENKRFGSAAKLRAVVKNPKTGKPVHKSTLTRALEHGSTL